MLSTRLRSFSRCRPGAIAAAAGLALAALDARATWSIVLIDVRTGEVAAGSATCLTNFDLRVNTPVLLTGIGAATAQSSVDSTGQNRGTIRNGLALAQTPAALLARLAQTDTAHQSRQYGWVDTLGRTLTFSGSNAGPWAGGQTSPLIGRVGDIAYAIQGNVLTGPCVVEQAVTAALAAPTDLADKLMLAMEAARLAGGDGRCSCAPENTQGCGCTLPLPAKSAHIAYMLVARAGDRDGSHTLTRGTFSSLALGRFSGNTGPRGVDLIAINTVGPALNLFRNATPDFADRPSPPLVPPPALADPLAATLPTGDYTTTSTDLTGDGLADLLAANATTNTLYLLPGRANQAPGPRSDIPLGASPRGIISAPLFSSSSTDAAVLLTTPAIRLLRQQAGTLVPGDTLALPATATNLQSADLDGDGDADLLCLVSSRSIVASWSNNGTGTFSPRTDIPAGTGPIALATTDLNADGRRDLVVANSGSRTLRLLTQQPDGSFVAVGLTLGTAATQLRAADFDGDGRTDILALQGDRVSVLLNTGSGSLTITGPSTLWPGSNLSTATIADLTGDSRPEIVIASSAGLQVLTNRGDGSFPNGNGFATGDYFLALNVANQTAANADPVVTLRTQYDQWRSTRPARPDAVRSSIASTQPGAQSTSPDGIVGGCLPADGTSAVTLRITPRDFQGSPAATPIAVTVRHAPGSNRLSTIGPAVINPDGTIDITLQAASAPGEDRFAITLSDGIRPVTLMPYPRLRVSHSVDYNRDGTIDLNDLSDYFTDFYTRPFIPGGPQPNAPTYPGLAVGYATACPDAADAPAPYAADAYRAFGYRVGYSPDANSFSLCPPAEPHLDNLSDFITAFYNPPSGCFAGWGS
jgi:hypothetical protein